MGYDLITIWLFCLLFYLYAKEIRYFAFWKEGLPSEARYGKRNVVDRFLDGIYEFIDQYWFGSTSGSDQFFTGYELYCGTYSGKKDHRSIYASFLCLWNNHGNILRTESWSRKE